MPALTNLLIVPVVENGLIGNILQIKTLRFLSELVVRLKINKRGKKDATDFDLSNKKYAIAINLDAES